MDPVTVLTGHDPLSIALFGLDRQLPKWIKPDGSKPVLDLGPGNKLIAGTVRLDYPEWDAEADRALWGYADASVGGIFAINLLEHLTDPRNLIREFGRVLAPGCAATVFVPDARSNMYLQDLDHKTPFVIDSFKNYLEPHPYYAKGHDTAELRVGAVFHFAVKSENTGIVAQLIKRNEDGS
jgi:SAM-dependent methyltransferase